MIVDLPVREGLYDPRHERDACGIGFIANVRGVKSHAILKHALTALENLAHRGAVGADRLSGDGAGVLTQIPYKLLRKELPTLQATLKRDCDLGVGMVFLPPRDHRAQENCLQIIEEAIAQAGMSLLAWRHVPLGRDALGEKARATCPEVRQVLVLRPEGLGHDAFERLLFLTRKRIERRCIEAKLGSCYLPSFSHRTIVYKGLMVAPQLARFYPDFGDARFETAIALFHQRYSTNTFPTWSLAHPFRFLAHNGEINTLRGNANWMRAREPELHSELWGDAIAELIPVIDGSGSDSAQLDNVFELLVMSGRDPLHTMMMLMPEAYQHNSRLDPDLRGFFEYHATLMEPWDGPAAVVFSDGRYAAATLDRNGLRPSRYWILDNDLVIVGSEVGIVPVPADRVVEKGRLGPGMMLAVDTLEGRVLHNDQIKREYAARKPYREWVARHMIRPPAHAECARIHNGQTRRQRNVAGRWVDRDSDEFVRVQKTFGFGAEELDRIFVPMMYESKEPVGSMGDDTPLAVLSAMPQTLYRYFKQHFAQVTNPPIDPLRERIVMSLNTAVGKRDCLLEESEYAARLIKFCSPVITEAQLDWLRSIDDPEFQSITLDAHFPVSDGPSGLESALERLCAQAEEAVDGGCALVILSDRGVGSALAPIPMLLATAAVHHHLIRAGKRMRASIVCETGEVREDHHYACLVGYGAALICPYLALETVAKIAQSDPRDAGISVDQAAANYLSAVDKGISKIMSKMGISTVNSYRGAQVFEIIGIDRDVVERYFTGTESRIGGVGLAEIARDVLRFHAEAYTEPPQLQERGIFRYLSKGEFHANNPIVFKALHKAVRCESWSDFQEYSRLAEERQPCNLRDLLEWKRAAKPVPLDKVEPAEEIARRFCTQAMSHGALSREAHEVLAIAMNRLGGKSNTGEGGEARERFYRYTKDMPELSHAPWHPKSGDWGNSAIKQVASGRFGVTPEYLVAAAELEIKMAQGSKPGEGGQIPGHKVSEEIARIRRSVPGVTLISPPPHHDIYSIEDLSQLIYDLKRVNRLAKVGVKLVSLAGVGTVAAGVAKGYADCVQISGADGGTGASPLASIRHAGIPWELGLAESQQVLVRNDLRGRVTVRVDGGLRTGRDVVVAALLGADEFGFGTIAVIAAGCVMARRCHLNNCPVGVATQRADLRQKFPGQPEHVVAFMMFVAQQTRMILAEMGFRKIDEIIGRTDLLRPRTNVAWPKSPVDLSALLVDPDPANRKPRRCMQPRNDRPEDKPPLDERIWRECEESIIACRPVTRSHPITNRERTVGARLAGEIARHKGEESLPPGMFTLKFRGSAGQSFGAFCNHGMRLLLEGDAQDYVGKGMHGGEIVITPPREARFAANENVIMGNTVMYGATGGSLFAAGLAGERLGVRNSGGRVVVEGCGDHGCEYMTNGIAVLLGPTGRNFGAGMSGGIAYVLDLENDFPDCYNPGMVSIERVEHDIDEELLRRMIERHFALTRSTRAAWILENWAELLPRFWKVVPHPSSEEASAQDQDPKAVERAALQELMSESTNNAAPHDVEEAATVAKG
jgi:glutamate synthase domain-containing protein 2/glutamate synthase domain-containing protein 1/glutamate synthase domain-containing protein 3